MAADKNPRLRVSRCAGGARRSGGIKFEFKTQHRNIPDKELIADLRRVARLLGARTLSKAGYGLHCRFGELTIYRRFGSWNNGLKKAGLEQSRPYRVPGSVVLADVHRVAWKLKVKRLTRQQYLAEGSYSPTLVCSRFGSWSRMMLAAGFAPWTNYPKKATDLALFENLYQLWRRLGRQPKCSDLVRPHSVFGVLVYQRRFGGFHKAMRAFVKWTRHRRSHTLAKTHKTARDINWRLRYLILRRDRFKCRACGRSPATEPNVRLQVDHIIPWSAGGETVMANLQTLCEKCNGGKSDLPWHS